MHDLTPDRFLGLMGHFTTSGAGTGRGDKKRSKARDIGSLQDLWGGRVHSCGRTDDVQGEGGAEARTESQKEGKRSNLQKMRIFHILATTYIELKQKGS